MQKAKRAGKSVNERLFPSGVVQRLLPIRDISHGMVKLNNGDYIKILEISPIGFSAMKNRDKNKVVDRFFGFCKNLPGFIQIKIITETTDVVSTLKYYKTMLDMSEDWRVYMARDDNYRLLKSLSSSEGKTKSFLLIIKYIGNPYTKKVSSDIITIKSDMDEQVNLINMGLAACGNQVIRHSNENDFLYDILYRSLNKKSSKTESVRERYVRLGNDLKDIAFYNGEEFNNLKIPATSVIAPRGIEPFEDYIIIDGIYYSYLFIKEDSFPMRVTASWVNNLAFYGCDVDIFFEEQDSAKMQDSLERSLSQHGVMMKYQKERGTQNELKDSMAAAEYMITKLGAKEKIYYSVICLTIWGETYEEMLNIRGRTIMNLNTAGIRISRVIHNTEEAFKMTLPICSVDKTLFQRFKRNMTTEGVASCYPFDEQRLKDQDGMVIGLSTSNSLALYNPFDTARYSNANIGIFGPSGSGKTYFSLMLARRLWLNNIGTMFVLPVKGFEYKTGIESLDGTFIDFSGGSKYCINLFDIMAQENLDKQVYADLDITEKSLLQQKVAEIQTFYELLFNKPTGIDAVSRSNLETAITELYARYGITTDNESIFDENGKKKLMPTIGDFYNLIRTNAALREFESVTRPFISGTLSNLNGQTNVDMDKKVIAFDVSNNDKNYLPAFMFLAITCCYSKIKENRVDKWAMFMDEGWKLLANENSAAQVNEVIKIVRGYAGSAIFATQNLADVLNASNGEAIIANMYSKFVLQIGDGEEEINKRTFKLTEVQFDTISRQPKGVVSLLVKNEAFQIQTRTSRLEEAIYTTDPNKVVAAKKFRNEEEEKYEKLFSKKDEEVVV